MKKIMELIRKIGHANLSIHADDSGTVTGVTLYDIKPFDSGPIETAVKALNMGWTVIVTKDRTQSDKGNWMPPKCYIGKGGATLDDLATALESVEAS